MAAIAAVMKMKCVRRQPAGGGQPEVIDLEEVTGNTTTETNLHVMPTRQNVPLARMDRITIDAAAAQGAFKIGASYKVEFTEL